MNIGIIRTVDGRYQIVDESDDNAPLVSFHNECDKRLIAEKVFLALVNYYAEQALKGE